MLSLFKFLVRKGLKITKKTQFFYAQSCMEISSAERTHVHVYCPLNLIIYSNKLSSAEDGL